MAEQPRNAEPTPGTWPTIMSWVGRTTALIGLFATLAGGVTWMLNRHRRNSERDAKMALAQAQWKQGEYQAAVNTYSDNLKGDPQYRPALDQQLASTMEWVEDFHVLARENQNAADLSAPQLDEIMSILDAGLTRSRGSQAADVRAHIGWAHWLNQHIAEREFGQAAEKNFLAALAEDPSNVYANAMLGNWMIQNGRNFDDAIHHFQIAVSTGKVRPFVRMLQIGGLINLDRQGARAELVKIADDMRKSSETLDERYKNRIWSYCFDPVVTNRQELSESLSAVPCNDAWNTYLWLDDNPESDHLLDHDFVHASLLEVNGKLRESLGEYQTLQRKLKNSPGSMKNSVDAAVARLSHG